MRSLTPGTTAMLRDQIQRLVRFTDDVAALAQAEESSTPLAFANIDVAELIAKSAAAVSERYRRKQVSLSTQLASSQLPPLWGDDQRLAQVLANLLDNALRQHHRTGGSTCTLTPMGANSCCASPTPARASPPSTYRMSSNDCTAPHRRAESRLHSDLEYPVRPPRAGQPRTHLRTARAPSRGPDRRERTESARRPRCASGVPRCSDHYRAALTARVTHRQAPCPRAPYLRACLGASAGRTWRSDPRPVGGCSGTWPPRLGGRRCRP